jgi:hypothetical protein
MSHTIGTYNMSFMSDLLTEIGPKMAFASEGAFLANLINKSDERRSYWENAKNLLKDFINEKQPSVVGLQEMNLTCRSETGTDAIHIMLKELEDKDYMHISNAVEANNAGLSIIYNTRKVGTQKFVRLVDNINQAGRPLLMLITELDT